MSIFQAKCTVLPPGSAVSILKALFQDVHVQVNQLPTQSWIQILSALKCFSFINSHKAPPDAHGVIGEVLTASFANFFFYGVCCSFWQSLMLTERSCVYNILISLMDSREKGEEAGVIHRACICADLTWQYSTQCCY